MLQKFLLIGIIFLLGSTAASTAAEPTASSPAAGGEARADSPFLTTVLDQSADCVRGQDAPTGYDPDTCSSTCGVPRCKGLPTYSDCTLTPDRPRSCQPGFEACTDGPACYCVVDL